MQYEALRVYNEKDGTMTFGFHAVIENEKGYEYFSHIWYGEDTEAWWKNEAVKKELRTAVVTGALGTVKTFMIDFNTDTVTEVGTVVKACRRPVKVLFMARKRIAGRAERWTLA